jgi:hypothetical protein
MTLIQFLTGIAVVAGASLATLAALSGMALFGVIHSPVLALIGLALILAAGTGAAMVELSRPHLHGR